MTIKGPRPVRWPEDGPPLLRMLGEAWRDIGPRVSLHPGDLAWRAALRDPEELLIWEERGEPAGLLEMDRSDSSCDIAVRPDRVEKLEPEILRWAEAEARRLGTGKTFIVGGFEGEEARGRLLTDLGYARTEHYYPHFLRLFEGPIDEVALADGYRVRPLRSPDDVQARIGLAAAAFGRTRMTPERYEGMRAGPGYDSDLDLLAVAPDGTPAAFALFWFDPVSLSGKLEPLGCHPDHRRRNLARALIAGGLRRLRERCAERAVVVTGSANAAAQSLYESCGYVDVGHDFDWEKPLS